MEPLHGAPADAVHPILHAAEHHAWFERIHPFVDGNGRVRRLLLNFMLLQEGYPPAVILASQRPRYLQALRTAGSACRSGRAVGQRGLVRFLIPNLAGEIAAASRFLKEE